MARVRYVGEPIAAVVAETRRAAPQDGVAAVRVDYDPLQAGTRCRSRGRIQRAAAAAGSRRQPGRDLRGHRRRSRRGVRRARTAIVTGRFYVQRYTGMPLETRGRRRGLGRRARAPDAVVVDPVAAHPARVAGGAAGDARERDPRDRPGRRRRLRDQAGRVPGGGRAGAAGASARPPGQVDRDAPRAPAAPPSTPANSGTTWSSRCRNDGTILAHARRRPVRSGRVHAQPGPAVPVADGGRAARAVPLSRLPLPRAGGADQQGPGGGLSRRGPARGGLCHRAHRRSARPGAWTRPGRGAAQELHPRGRVSLGRRHRIRPGLPVIYDSGDYVAGLDRALELSRLRALAAHAGAPSARAAKAADCSASAWRRT